MSNYCFHDIEASRMCSLRYLPKKKKTVRSCSEMLPFLFFIFVGSIAMSFLEIGGIFGSVISGHMTDKLVKKVQCN